MVDKKYLEQRGHVWWYQRAFPVALRPHLDGGQAGLANFRVNLRTDSLKVALQRRKDADREFERVVSRARASSLGEVLEASEEVIRDWRRFYEDDGDDEVLMNEAKAIGKREGEQAAQRFWKQVVQPEWVPIEVHLDEWQREDTVSPRSKMERVRVVKQLAAWRSALSVDAVDRKVARAFVKDVLAVGKRTAVTVNKDLSNLSSFWNWLMAADHVKVNPWKSQRLRKPRRGLTDAQRPFTDEEMRLIFGPLMARDLRDFAVIGALTGMRIAEIGRMKAEHVHLDHMILDVQGTKTEASVRTIPLHSLLREIVVRRLALSSKHGGVMFPELPERSVDSALEAASPITKRFTIYRRSVGVDDCPGGRRSLVNFHSFRHWFSTEAERTGGQPWIIETITGHARQGMMLSRYSKGGDIDKQMRPIVEAIRLPYGCTI